MSDLKPCPFCGGEAETLTAESMHGGYLFGIMCNDCRSRGDVYDTEAEAIAAWNTRHVETCENMREKFGYKRLFVCSECGVSFDPDCEINYCPSCGCKVVGE